MHATGESEILRAVRESLEGEQRLVLAVSGGMDSMTLLDAAARVRPEHCSLVVATVDHGTGAAATEAVALVCAEAARRSLPVRTEWLALPAASEAEWRTARWAWLRQVASQERAAIATAHTRDDHVETVVMRLLRGAGARGLAALHAPSAIRRPLLAQSRQSVESYVRSARLPYVDDPSNADRRFLRNRVRLDLLPAIRRVRPAFDEEILALSLRAAEVRRGMESVARHFVRSHAKPGSVDFDAVALAALPDPVLRELWPALAAVSGVALDRRGTERLSQFSRSARSGDRMQVAGGIEILRGREVLTLRPSAPGVPEEEVPLAKAGVFGRFRFRALPVARIRDVAVDPWLASLPTGVDARVRAWKPGDRMAHGAGPARRVKRFFADAGIPGPVREGWPVVLVDGSIVWIPGVRRSPLAADVSRRSSTVYHCERYSL